MYFTPIDHQRTSHAWKVLDELFIRRCWFIVSGGARKNGRQFQKGIAPVAAEQFEERQLLGAAIVDSGWFAWVQHWGNFYANDTSFGRKNFGSERSTTQPRSVPSAALRIWLAERSMNSRIENAPGFGLTMSQTSKDARETEWQILTMISMLGYSVRRRLYDGQYTEFVAY